MKLPLGCGRVSIKANFAIRLPLSTPSTTIYLFHPSSPFSEQRMYAFFSLILFLFSSFIRRLAFFLITTRCLFLFHVLCFSLSNIFFFVFPGASSPLILCTRSLSACNVCLFFQREYPNYQDAFVRL